MIDEWLLRGRQIAAEGRIHEVFGGLSLADRVALCGYWDEQKEIVKQSGACRDCGGCELLRCRNGKLVCPHTGEECFVTEVELWRCMV